MYMSDVSLDLATASVIAIQCLKRTRCIGDCLTDIYGAYFDAYCIQSGHL